MITNFQDYARVDFAIGDNDPVYFAVNRAKQEWGYDWACRFCVGMLSYYHMGTAVRAADYEGAQFWEFLKNQYSYAPRGGARRHFRGTGGMRSLDSMIKFAPNPNVFFSQLPDTFLKIKYVTEALLEGFGPYFWLKIADYMDRCLSVDVDYRGLEFHLSKVPAKAANLVYPKLSTPDAFMEAVALMTRHSCLAPPLYDRPVGPAEVESALCDWHQARKGENWPGMDLIVKREALKGYGPKAELMATWLPPLVPKEIFVCQLT